MDYFYKASGLPWNKLRDVTISRRLKWRLLPALLLFVVQGANAEEAGLPLWELGVGVVDNSPLVKSRTYTTVVGGLVWTLMRSEKSTRAENEEEN